MLSPAEIKAFENGLALLKMDMGTAPGVDYSFPHYANSPLPIVDATVTITDATRTGASATAIVTATLVGGAMEGPVTSIIVNDGGSGYSATPNVTISSTTGINATATAIVAGGVITGITVTNGGSGYEITGGMRKFIDCGFLG